MDQISFQVIALGWIPECILTIWVGSMLMGIQPKVKRLMIIGILQGISAGGIEPFLPYEYNMIIRVLLFMIYVKWILEVSLLQACFSVILPSSIMILIKGCVMIFLNIKFMDLWCSDWMRIGVLLPHELIFIGMIYYGYKQKFSLLNEWTWLKKIMG